MWFIALEYSWEYKMSKLILKLKRLVSLKCLPAALYRVFSLTWPASMQIYWNKRKRLHKKRVKFPQDLFGIPSWPPLHCFGTPIWPPWRHVKTLYKGSWFSSHKKSVHMNFRSQFRKYKMGTQPLSCHKYMFCEESPAPFWLRSQGKCKLLLYYENVEVFICW